MDARKGVFAFYQVKSGGLKLTSTLPEEIIVRARLAFLLLLIFLTSCTPGTPAPAEPTSTPRPTATPVPTVGPTPTLPPPLTILVLPPDMDAERSQAYQTAVYDLAQSAGYRFQVLNKLTTEDMALVSNLKIVIALTPDSEIASLAAAMPQAQFLAVNIPGVTPGGNTSVLGGESLRVDHVAFMAGYIGAMITEDYHTGVILRKGSPDAEKIRTAFRAGQEYYCGLCNPYAGPFEPYPLDIEVPEDAKTNEYSAYADFLIRRKVDTLFMQSGADVPELLQYLPTVGVLAIGTQTPAKKSSNWVVTLQPDYLVALKSAWPELAAGQGGKAFPAPLSFTDVNPELFSPGKQQLARKTLDDLLAGLIFTNVNP